MKIRRFHLIIGIIAASLASSAALDSVQAKKHSTEKLLMADAAGSIIKTPSGLQYQDTQVGTGPSPRTGQTCVMHYTGWLLTPDGKRGKKFDSSVDRGQPFSFQIGVGQVIKGWDEGVSSMHSGGKRTLMIPSALGYGARGAGGDIPPNANLIFDVELLKVQ